MFCRYCGKEIGDNDRFCSYCGRSLTKDSGSTSDVGDYIEDVGEQIGSGIDGAVNDVSDELRNLGEDVSEGFDRIGDAAEHIQKNWRDYLTPRNMEYLTSVSLALPVFMNITIAVFEVIAFIFVMIPLIGPLITVLIPNLVKVIFIVAVCGGAAGIIYLLVKEPYRRTTSAYITAGASILAVLACIGHIANWGSISTVFAVISFIWGLDVLSRVVLQELPIESEPDLARDFGFFGTWYAEYKAAHPSSKEDEAVRIQNDPYASYFDGKGLTLLGLILLSVFVSLITCGIATPWMLCKVYRWRKEHTVINGRRLAFTGTGGSLFGHWILWYLLTLVTCGIYGLFMFVALKRWEMKNTVYADDPYRSGFFDGNTFQYIGYSLIEALLLLVTCGLGFPWAAVIMQKWQVHHCLVGGDRMRFEGTALGILGQYIIIFILTLLTFGLYSPWGTVRMNKYMYANTKVDWRDRAPIRR